MTGRQATQGEGDVLGASPALSPDNLGYVFPWVMAAAVGFVGGSVLTSLGLCAVDHYDWSALNNIAGFWYGHLSALCIILIVVGFYYQSREQLKREREQLKADREKERTKQLENRRWQLELSQTRLERLADKLRGYLQNPVSHPSRALNGLSDVVGALIERDSKGEDEASEIEILIDPETLSDYLKLCTKIEQMEQELTGHASFVADRHLVTYAQRLDADVKEFARKLHNYGISNNLSASLTGMVRHGWRITEKEYQHKWLIVAVRGGHTLTVPDSSGKLEDGFVELLEAYKNRFQR